MFKKYFSIFKITMPLVLAITVIIWFIYSQRFVQDSPNTATQGIVFTTTLNLDVYKNVSSGRKLLGKVDRYSRGDRHTDVITVYCNDFCKKK